LETHNRADGETPIGLVEFTWWMWHAATADRILLPPRCGRGLLSEQPAEHRTDSDRRSHFLTHVLIGHPTWTLTGLKILDRCLQRSVRLQAQLGWSGCWLAARQRHSLLSGCLHRIRGIARPVLAPRLVEKRERCHVSGLCKPEAGFDILS